MLSRQLCSFASAMILALCASGTRAAPAEPVRVAAAISLKEALTEIATAYAAEGRGKVEFTFGSSGQLQAQVEYGAPVDAFISAAHQQVDGLIRSKHADASSQRVVAGNRLVLVVPAGAKSAPASFDDLRDARFRRVAIGEPKTVPAGQYAAQALKSMKLDEALRPRLVYGANARQVLDYVERGEVDAGIVYATDARESGDRVRVAETAGEATHDPIEYPAVIVAGTGRRKAAGDFLDYLGGEKARAIFAGKGFTTPADQASKELRGASPRE